jgi:hypothetical protein
MTIGEREAGEAVRAPPPPNPLPQGEGEGYLGDIRVASVLTPRKIFLYNLGGASAHGRIPEVRINCSGGSVTLNQLHRSEENHIVLGYFECLP